MVPFPNNVCNAGHEFCMKSYINNAGQRFCTKLFLQSLGSGLGFHNLFFQNFRRFTVLAVLQPLEIPLFSEKPISSRSASSSDLRQISLLERLTKTHQIWNLLEVGRIGAVHLLKDRDIGVWKEDIITEKSLNFRHPEYFSNYP